MNTITIQVRKSAGEGWESDLIGMATFKTAIVAYEFAKLMRSLGYDSLTINWCHFEPGLPPGEQGMWSYEELEHRASKTPA